jgi:hypothetical protein
MFANTAAPNPLIAPTRAAAGIADLLLRAAQLHPKSGAYLASSVSGKAEYLSYPTLLEKARRILGGLQRRSLPGRSKPAMRLQ